MDILSQFYSAQSLHSFRDSNPENTASCLNKIISDVIDWQGWRAKQAGNSSNNDVFYVVHACDYAGLAVWQLQQKAF